MPVTDRYDLTAKERVQGFITAFEFYKHDCDLQPLPDEGRFEFFTSEDQARSMRIRTHRAIALRKFVLQHKDAFYLVKIHLALEELGRLSIGDSSREDLERFLDQLKFGNVGAVGIIESDRGEPTLDSSIVDDLLNGQYLHSDTDKMSRHQARPDMSVNLALFGWLHLASTLCEITYQMSLETLKSIEAENV